MTYIEANFENLTFSNLTFSDLHEILSQSLETAFATITFTLLLIYVLFLEKNSDLLFRIVTVYIAFIAFIVTTKKVREQLLIEVEFHHNLRKIKRCYSNKKLFESDYPIIMSLLDLKQKQPKINLFQLHRLNEHILTFETLTNLLYGIEDHKYILQEMDLQRQNQKNLWRQKQLIHYVNL